MSELKVNTITAADNGRDLVLRGGDSDSDGMTPAGAVTFASTVTLPAGSMIEVDGGEPTPLGGGGGGGGAWNVIGSATFDNNGAVTITGIDSTYDTYCIGVSNIVSSAGGVLSMRVGNIAAIGTTSTDSQGFRTIGNYKWRLENGLSTGILASSYSNKTNGTFFPLIPAALANGTKTMGCMIYMYGAANGNTDPVFSGQYVLGLSSSGTTGVTFQGSFEDPTPLIVERIQIFNTVNITSGRVTVWGISHAAS